MLSESPLKLEPPELVTVDVTVKEVYEALKKNGFEHIRESWADGAGGCVLQQTAWNLNVVATHDNWNNIDDAYGIDYPGYNNEVEGRKWAKINQEVENKWDSYALDRQLNKLGSVPKKSKWYDETWGDEKVGIGSSIVHWNDKREPENRKEYVLETYDEVAQMAYDLLSPHFEKTVKLLKYEYPNKPTKVNG